MRWHASSDCKTQRHSAKNVARAAGPAEAWIPVSGTPSLLQSGASHSDSHAIVSEADAEKQNAAGADLLGQSLDGLAGRLKLALDADAAGVPLRRDPPLFSFFYLLFLSFHILFSFL